MTADDDQLWARLQARATPLLTLALPAGASAMEAGVGSAGALLALGDLLDTAWIADSDPRRLAQLRRLPAASGVDAQRWTAATPARALRRWGPVDFLLLSGGLADVSARELTDGLKPGAQLAVAVSGLPGAALSTERRLRAAGFDELSIVAPWPNAKNAAAWVDLESAAAWRALQSHFRPSTRTLPRRLAAAAWQEAAGRFPDATRLAFRSAATVAYVMGRR